MRGMSPACDIDKARRRGETWPVDPELREALDQLGTNLRGEVRSVDAGLRGALNQVVVDLRGEIRESESRMRLHFDVVGESLRGDVRAIAEGLAASREQVDRRIDEEDVAFPGRRPVAIDADRVVAGTQTAELEASPAAT